MNRSQLDQPLVVCTQMSLVARVWRHSLLGISALLLIIACDDPAPPPTLRPEPDAALLDLGPDLTPDLGLRLDSDLVDDLAIPDLDVEPDMERAPAPGWVTLTLTPGRTYYQLSDTPTLDVSSFDIYGDPITAPLYQYRFDPDTFELNSSSGEVITPYTTSAVHEVTLRLIAEGDALIEVCALDPNDLEATSNICATRPLIIDDGAPEITIFWPPRGAALAARDAWPTWDEVASGLPAPTALFPDTPEIIAEEIPETISDWIPVYGVISDEGGEVSAALNGVPISVDDEGRFSALIPARSGYVGVRVSADDGVRATLSVDQRWALYARSYLTTDDPTRSVIERGITIGLHQDLIDQDAPSGDGEPLEITEAAQFVSLLLSALDPALLLGAGALIDTPELNLSLVEIELGEPEVDLLITAEGLSLFAGLPNAVVTVSGRLALGGAEVDLSGDLEIGIGSFADYALTHNDMSAVSVDFLSGGVALNRLTPRLNNEAANALLEVLESTARALVVDQLEQQLLAALRAEIPQVLELAVDDLFRSFNEIDLNFATFEGAPDVSLRLNITPSEVVKYPGLILQLFADWAVTRLNLNEGEVGIELRGVPSLYPRTPPPTISGGLSLQLQLDTINSLLAEMMRGGLLSLEPPVPDSARFFYSKISTRASLPPVVTLGDASEAYPLYFELGGLALSLTQSMSGVEDEYELAVRVGAQLKVEGGSFSIELGDLPDIVVTLVTLNNERALVSEQLIENLVSDQLWPTLSSAITDQVQLGFPPTALPIDQLNQVGVDLDATGELLVRFSDLVDYHEGGWLSLSGGLSIRFE